MSEFCQASTAEKCNKKIFFPQILHKSVHVSPYLTLSRHIKLMAEFSVSKAKEPYHSHDANELGPRHVKAKGMVSPSSK